MIIFLNINHLSYYYDGSQPIKFHIKLHHYAFISFIYKPHIASIKETSFLCYFHNCHVIVHFVHADQLVHLVVLLSSFAFYCHSSDAQG